MNIFNDEKSKTYLRMILGILHTFNTPYLKSFSMTLCVALIRKMKVSS